MDQQPYETLSFAHEGALYSGEWRSTYYSVTVKYGERQVSATAPGPNKPDIAKALLIQMIDAEGHRPRVHQC
jgi:hypothetical protein